MIGTKLAHYEITSHLGSGGMGEVYQATDSKLGRSVAIKFLPAAVASDADRLSRFRREAQVLASLNHSNIAHIYGLEESGETRCIVMELVEGETLQARIQRGPIPVDESLTIAKQIAEALEAAHEKGVIHRDLKPGNVMLTGDGRVKVLDFGLAKAYEADPSNPGMSNSPTIASMAATNAGIIMGTAGYMSPEQARGKTLDRRTDIWAFGAVMYEMLTAKQAFGGENLSDTIAAVIRGEPDWSAHPAEIPRAIRRLLERCLRKDPRQRIHDAADLRIELDDLVTAAETTVAPAPAARPQRIPIALALLAGAVIANAFWWLYVRSSSDSPSPMHLSVALAPGTVSTGGRTVSPFAVSPDGKWIVYLVTRAGRRQLFLRAIQESEGKPINGTEDAAQPFFSPDGQWIGFGAGKELKKVPVSGGSPIVICSLSSTGFVSGAWGSDDKIVFVPDFNAGIWSVPASGGTPQLVLKTDEGKDRIAYADVQVLPENKGILFTLVLSQTIRAEDQKVALLESGATDPRILVEGGSNARYLPTGHLIYIRSGALLSVAFDVARLALTGTPTSVIEDTEVGLWGNSTYSVSENGTLIYEPRSAVKAGRILVAVDRKADIRPITERRDNSNEFSISPDGRHVAARVVAANDDLWTYEVANGTPLRLTFETPDEIFPQWTADGTRIAFGTRIGKIFWKLADGTGKREEVSHGEHARYPSSFSSDGKTLAFVEIHPSRRRDIWLMRLDGDRNAQPFQNTDADEWAPKFSPDGRWLAYVSDETGREEIYIRPIGSSGGRKRISTEGGTWPAWNRNGLELFFIKGDKLAAVTLDAQTNPVGRDHVILDAPKLDDLKFPADSPFYDVMPDGEHFVMLLAPQYPSPPHYNVVVNWFTELQQRVPVK